MMQQKQLVAMMDLMIQNDNFPYDIQIETNGTKAIQPVLRSAIQRMQTELVDGKTNWFWSISPKLWNVAGEKSADAWKPEVIAEMWKCSQAGWLKFVMTDSDAAWDELHQKAMELKEMGVGFPIYVMPVGATAEQQEDSRVVGAIADRALREGYHISGRLHAILWGNTVGV